MTQFRTIDLGKASYASARTPLRRYAPPAQFVSQMLQQRHAASGPARAPQTIATDAYADTARATIIRMPAGYRRTVVA